MIIWTLINGVLLVFLMLSLINGDIVINISKFIILVILFIISLVARVLFDKKLNKKSK